MASIGPDIIRHPKTEEQKRLAAEKRLIYPTVSTAPARAFQAMQVYATSNKLKQQVLLTVEKDLPDPFDEFQKVMAKRTRREGKQPWVAVAEIGEDNNFHLHVLLSQTTDALALRNDWNYGMTDLKFLETDQDVRQFSVYLSKGFSLPAHQRLDFRRYRSAPGFKPKWIDYGYATHQEAETLAQQLAGKNWARVDEWQGNSSWCAGGYNWES